jgi:hypothetical protein
MKNLCPDKQAGQGAGRGKQAPAIIAASLLADANRAAGSFFVFNCFTGKTGRR